MAKKELRLLATALAFMAPFGALYLVFTIWPVFQGFYVSLFDWGLMGPQGFVGLDNYTKAFGDKFFWGALWSTTKFSLVTVPLLVLLAVVLSLIHI